MLSLWVPSETLLRLAHGVVGAVANPPCTSLWVLSETLLARLAASDDALLWTFFSVGSSTFSATWCCPALPAWDGAATAGTARRGFWHWQRELLGLIAMDGNLISGPLACRGRRWVCGGDAPRWRSARVGRPGLAALAAVAFGVPRLGSPGVCWRGFGGLGSAAAFRGVYRQVGGVGVGIGDGWLGGAASRFFAVDGDMVPRQCTALRLVGNRCFGSLSHCPLMTRSMHGVAVRLSAEQVCGGSGRPW